MLKEGTGHTGGSVRFKLNGQVKTINHPVTGAALHALAGSPTSLTAGGKKVPNDHEKFHLAHDEELVSEHKPGAVAPPLADKATPAENKEAILDEVAKGHGGPYATSPSDDEEED